jgi:hypothetical protein
VVLWKPGVLRWGLLATPVRVAALYLHGGLDVLRTRVRWLRAVEVVKVAGASVGYSRVTPRRKWWHSVVAVGIDATRSLSRGTRAWGVNLRHWLKGCAVVLSRNEYAKAGEPLVLLVLSEWSRNKGRLVSGSATRRGRTRVGDEGLATQESRPCGATKMKRSTRPRTTRSTSAAHASTRNISPNDIQMVRSLPACSVHSRWRSSDSTLWLVGGHECSWCGRRAPR